MSLSLPGTASSPEKKKIASRLMEVYAGFLAQTDAEVGRLVKGVKDLGEWDNTLFIYIVGDNGPAPAGGVDGVFNEMVSLNGLREDPAVVMSKLKEFGGPKANNEYPVGFAWALATPFQFTKQFAGLSRRHSQPDGGHLAQSHQGSRRSPLAVPPCDRYRADAL